MIGAATKPVPFNVSRCSDDSTRSKENRTPLGRHMAASVRMHRIGETRIARPSSGVRWEGDHGSQSTPCPGGVNKP
jgi:hypothetical protein